MGIAVGTVVTVVLGVVVVVVVGVVVVTVVDSVVTGGGMIFVVDDEVDAGVVLVLRPVVLEVVDEEDGDVRAVDVVVVVGDSADEGLVSNDVEVVTTSVFGCAFDRSRTAEERLTLLMSTDRNKLTTHKTCTIEPLQRHSHILVPIPT